MAQPLFTHDEVGNIRRRLRRLFYTESLTFSRAARESGIDRDAFSRLLEEKPVSDNQLTNIYAYLRWREEESKRFFDRLADQPQTVPSEERMRRYLKEYKRYGRRPPNWKRWRNTERDLFAYMDRDLKIALKALFHEAIAHYKLRFADSRNYWSWKRELFKTLKTKRKRPKQPGIY